MLRRLQLAPLLLLLACLPAAGTAQDMELPFPTTRADVVRSLTPVYPGVDGEDSTAPRRELRAGAAVAFDPESGEIQPASRELLDTFAVAFAQDFPGSMFIVAGHVGRGLPPQAAIDLSLQRAEAVKAYLVTEHGLDPNRFLVQGYGDLAPLPAREGGESDPADDRIEFIRL